jgi:putative heme iron utilization protein
MATTNKIFIQDGTQTIELSGADKEAFLEQRAKDQAESALLEAIALEKDKARASALTKLGEIAGLTKEELDAIL